MKASSRTSMSGGGGRVHDVHVEVFFIFLSIERPSSVPFCFDEAEASPAASGRQKDYNGTTAEKYKKVLLSRFTVFSALASFNISLQRAQHARGPRTHGVILTVVAVPAIMVTLICSHFAYAFTRGVLDGSGICPRVSPATNFFICARFPPVRAPLTKRRKREAGWSRCG